MSQKFIILVSGSHKWQEKQTVKGFNYCKELLGCSLEEVLKEGEEEEIREEILKEYIKTNFLRIQNLSDVHSKRNY